MMNIHFLSNWENMHKNHFRKKFLMHKEYWWLHCKFDRLNWLFSIKNAKGTTIQLGKIFHGVSQVYHPGMIKRFCSSALNKYLEEYAVK